MPKGNRGKSKVERLGHRNPVITNAKTHHRRLRRRCSGQLQRHPGGQHNAERLPLHRCSGALHHHPAPPGAVHREPRLLHIVTDNADSIIIFYFSTGHRAQLPRTTDAPEKDNHWRKRSRSTATSGNSSTASPVYEPHLPEVDQLGHPRCSTPPASEQPQGRRPR